MASLFKRGTIFWIKDRGHDGRIHRESTNLATNTVEGRREAKQFADETTLRERLISRQEAGSKFADWVTAYRNPLALVEGVSCRLDVFQKVKFCLHKANLGHSTHISP